MLLDFMLSFLSDLLRLANGVTAGVTNQDMLEALCALRKRVSRTRLDHAAQCLLKAKQMFSRYVSHKAAVLWLALGIFYGE